MSEAEQFCEQIRAAIPNIRSGSLRFWGVWFGRPHDNEHRLIACSAEKDVLHCHFDEGEALHVWFP
jgi:hypothetical protein